MKKEESLLNIKRAKNNESSIWIRLYNMETHKVFYKVLTQGEFLGVQAALKGIKWK